MHHGAQWLQELTNNFRTVTLDNIEVVTMNGNPAKAFQWFGLKRESHPLISADYTDT
jgi:hypothetical protein